MDNVDLSKAKKLRSVNYEQDANQLIAKGWTLIATAPGKDESGYPIVKYSFAWFKDSDPE